MWHIDPVARAAFSVAAGLAVAASNGALPAVPTIGPPNINIIGFDIPLASMTMGMVGLFMARGISAAREGPAPGGRYLTGLLTLIIFVLIVENQPRPGVALGWGAGVGGSGILLYEMMKQRMIAVFEALLFGGAAAKRAKVENGTPPDGDDSAKSG